MKWLVLLAVLAIAYLVWRGNRVERKAAPPPSPSAGAKGEPQAMIACTACGVHLPRGDAVEGSGGRLYCSQEHRLTHERQ